MRLLPFGLFSLPFVENGLYPREVVAQFPESLDVVQLLSACGLDPQVEKRLRRLPALSAAFFGRDFPESSCTYQ